MQHEPLVRNAFRANVDPDCELRFASNGADAIPECVSFRPHIVVVDLRVPGMKAIDALARIREIEPDAVRVALANSNHFEAAMRAVNESEVWRFLQVPWSTLALNRMMRAAMQHYEKQIASRNALQKLASVGMLAAGVVHDLRTPISVILNMVHAMRMDIPEASEQHDDFELVVQAATHCNDIVGEVLAFARTSGDGATVPVEMADVVNRSVILANYYSKGRAIIQHQVADELPSVTGSPQQLTQVIVNLILNASQALEEAGAEQPMITIGCRLQDGRIQTTISDNGPGIPEHLVGSIFEPFVSTKTDKQGTGLGLAVSRWIAREHSGDIWVDSKEGEGTTFTISLPTCSKTAEIDVNKLTTYTPATTRSHD